MSNKRKSTMAITNPEGIALLAQLLRDDGEIEFADMVEGATEVHVEINGDRVVGFTRVMSLDNVIPGATMRMHFKTIERP